MLEAKLSDFRKPEFFNQTEIIHIVDHRKKKDIGFFVPANLIESFKGYLQQEDKNKKLALLQRIAQAQKIDPIEEVGIADGIK